MKALEVRRNGELVATAGIGDDGVLSAIVTWVGGQSPRPPEGQWHFHVSGADSRTDEHVDWPTPSIGVGDEITIRIIEADPDQISPEGGRKVVDTYAMGVEMQRRLNSSGG